MITEDNIKNHEMIGLHTKIIESTNSQLIGINGNIVDETKSMFTIQTGNDYKKIAKMSNKWQFNVENKSIVINGASLCKRSEDRLGMKK